MNKVSIIKKKYLSTTKGITISVLIAVLYLFNISNIKAQIFIGAKAGARTSWLEYDDFAAEDYEKSLFFGFSAGLTGAIKVQKRFMLQLDIMYAQNGKKVSGITDPSLQNDAKYHYLNTPIVYKLDFNGSIADRPFQWHVGAGPNVNFWLGGKGLLKSVELEEESIDELEYKIIFDAVPANPEFGGLYYNDFNRVQVGLIVATGLVLEPLPGQLLMIDFRYEWGHSYIAREKGRFTNVSAYRDDLTARNQAIQISVAYAFDIINKGKKEKKIYYKN
jgi:hypothetical protein